ncbi:lantibiotic dehydratase [Nocardiopsis sp. DSM 44743]|uniref:Lantibiotic dehydratase n=1 Tax=Nocardiopsis lambiniae TaxID=3075539 RepID=A0ABU2MHY4_9ACTN|nr:lantibiotic dehydratase [Nocardiopsis sp. DSM 44743]
MYVPLTTIAPSLRAATRPRTRLPACPDPATGSSAELRTWAVGLLGDRELMRALSIASPSLTEALQRLVDSDRMEETRVRRTAFALVRYLLRAHCRATPFGLFAGVAPLTLGAETSVTWCGHHQEVPRLGTGKARGQFSQASGEVERSVVLAQTVRVHGERLCLDHRPHPNAPDQAAAVSLRLTSAVSLLAKTAHTPVPLAHLHKTLATAFPDAPEEKTTALVEHLLDQRLLLDSATAPPSPQSALSHGDSDAEAVDVRIRATVTVHRNVAQEAARATAVAARLSPHPEGPPAWADYHRRCLETYGQNARVDLLTLTGPAGLGYPSSYRHTRLPAPPPASGKLDAAFVEAAATAALHGQTELDLDDPTWAHLMARTPKDVPAHAEIRSHLAAASPADVDQGRYRLWVTGISKGAGTLTGRFAHLDGMDTTVAGSGLPTLTQGALPVQVLAPPMADTAAHLCRTPVLAPTVLPIDVHPPTDPDTEVLHPEDLAVRIDPDHLRLVHAPTGRVLEPFHPTALNVLGYTHPLARFVTELPRARTALYLTCDPWPEPLRRLPFLPRLRAGRTVLAPARWRLTPATWSTARTRTHLPLPRYAALVEGERHLPLDLEDAAHRSLVDTHLYRHGHVILTETPSPEDFAWCDGHAHELVLPIGTTTPPTRLPATVTVRTAVEREATGNAWVSAHLYADPSLFPQILAELPALEHRTGDELRFWFVRYRDHHGPHLRLRLHSTGHTALHQAVTSWGHDLVGAGLLHDLALHTYRPEYDRYGHGPVMKVAENAFVHDSRAAIAQHHTTYGDPSQGRALAALSLLRIADAMGADTKWTVAALPRPRNPVDRATLAIARHLLTHPEDLPAPVTATWGERDHVLAAYRKRLDHPLRVVSSLWHMHHNRAHGPDRDDEHDLLALTRSLGLARRHLEHPDDDRT